MSYLDENGLIRLWMHINSKLDSMGNVPTVSEPNMQLVTDSNGEQEWTERTHWKEITRGVILPETNLAPEGLIITSEFNLEVDEIYTVIWNGVEYTCTAFEEELDGIPSICLGNTSALGGSNTDDSPFVIIKFQIDVSEIMEGATGLVAPLDGESGVLSILGNVPIYHKLGKEYLPDNMNLDSLNIINGSAIGSVRTRYSNEDESAPAGEYSFAEGENTVALGVGSHAEGLNTFAIGSYSHSEGATPNTLGGSYADIPFYEANSLYVDTGVDNVSIKIGEVLEFNGRYFKITNIEGSILQLDKPLSDVDLNNITINFVENIAYGEASHAEGTMTSASGKYSHAEGYSTMASGDGSHSEGDGTQAIGTDSHAEGFASEAIGTSSHSEG